MRLRPAICFLASITFCVVARADIPAYLVSGLATQVLITSGDSPANHLVTPPSGLDGVARILMTFTGVPGMYGCSGSLLLGGQYILTAGHCVTGPAGQALASAQVRFNLAGGPVDIAAAAAFTPPGWDGNYNDGSDIALIKLATPAPITGYDLVRTLVGGNVEIAGYGRTGTGAAGVTGGFGTLHSGENTYEILWTDNKGVDSWYGYDFDSGLAANDAFGMMFGLPDLGLGTAREVDIASGDSGGPSFVGGRIAGVHSWGGTFGISPPDVDTVLNSSWGEVAADTRVDLYSAWIDSVVNPVPEPATVSLLGGVMLVWLVRKSKTSKS